MRRSTIVAIVVAGLAVLVGIGAAGYLGWTHLHKSEAQTKLAPFLKRLKANDPQVRADAIADIARLDAPTAVPALVEVLAIPDEDMRLQAAMALGELGAPAVPALQTALADRDAAVRFYAVWALGLAGPAAKPAAPAVVARLRDADSDVRYKAAFALGHIGVESDDTVAALIGVLQDADETVASEAAVALVRLGPHAAGPLRKALTQPALALVAARTLGQMAAAKDEDASRAAALAAPDVLRAFDGQAAEDRDGLIIYFGGLGKAGLPAVRETLKGKDPVLGARCAVALRALAMHEQQQGQGTSVAQAVELLVGMLGNDDSLVRAAAATELGRVSWDADTVGPALANAFLDDCYAVSHAAFQALDRTNASSETVVRERITAAKGDEKLRLACLVPARNRPLLEENLKHADAGLRLRIACALATDAVAMRRSDEFCNRLVPIFAEALKAPSAAQRRDAAEGLRKVAPFAGPASTLALQAALKDEDAEVRRLASQGLAQAPKADPK
jgi:HEAT repeat protein